MGVLAETGARAEATKRASKDFLIIKEDLY